MGRLFLQKIAPSHGGSGSPSNTWFSGPTRVLNPNGISISSAIFAGLSSVTDRQTDHATRSVTIGRIYVRSTVMQPNTTTTTTVLQPFFRDHPGEPEKLLDFRGRHTDHLVGCHSIRTNQCPPPPSPHFLHAGCPSCRPTNSVKALKANISAE